MKMRNNNLGLVAVTKLLVIMISLFSSMASAQVGLVPTQEVLQVDWGFDISDVLNATVGDIIQFTWPASLYHDIFIHPSGNCDDSSGRIEVHPATSGGNASYTFTPQDASPDGKNVFFACAVGGGIHCQYNVNQLVKVYPKLNTQSPTVPPPTTPPAPTASPSSAPTVSPTAAPSPSPSASPTSQGPTVATPSPSSNPTVAASQSPTNMPSPSPTNSPSASPSMATASPSANPSAATDSPSASPATSPSSPPTGLASASPSGSPTNFPTSEPSAAPVTSPPTMVPSQTASASPTDTPSTFPTIATPSPTTEIRTTTVEDLEMTLFGVSELSEQDVVNWEGVTALFQTAYFADGQKGILEYDSQLEVVSSERRRQRTRRGRQLQDEEDAITIVYNQVMTYRLNDMDVTDRDMVTEPFATDFRRNQYVEVYLNNVGETSALSDVTAASEVTGDAIATTSPTPSPTPAPALPSPTTGIEDGGDNDSGDGLSTGAIIGVAAGTLFACLLCSLFFFADRNRGGGDDYSYDEEENPYIPPSPASLGDAYTSNNQSVEHVFMKD